MIGKEEVSFASVATLLIAKIIKQGVTVIQEASLDDMTTTGKEVKADNRGSEVSPDLIIEVLQIEDSELHLGIPAGTMTDALVAGSLAILLKNVLRTPLQ